MKGKSIEDFIKVNWIKLGAKAVLYFGKTTLLTEKTKNNTTWEDAFFL